MKRNRSLNQLRARRLERVTLQDEAGQVNFGVGAEEEEELEDLGYQERKDLVLKNAKAAKSLDRLDFNQWDQWTNASPKNLKILVSVFKGFTAFLIVLG